MMMKWLYLFKDPMGSGDVKVGITKNPKMRLGVYQCSYSAKSHKACFDYVFLQGTQEENENAKYRKSN
jgi:hypothetical protein